MKTAHKIYAHSFYVWLAIAHASRLAIATDNIWQGKGYTVYVFADNSFLAVSGADYMVVDADNMADVLRYEQWLGNDAQYDAERINNMREALKHG